MSGMATYTYLRIQYLIRIDLDHGVSRHNDLSGQLSCFAAVLGGPRPIPGGTAME